MSIEEISARCCIVGGGPAGMMLGLLLARAGVDVLVMEKHNDFLRDFRGDTVHPSTLELMHELGLLKDFLSLPHTELKQLGGQVGKEMLTVADFSYLHTQCKFIAMIPQWDFLSFLADRAKRYKSFSLRMITEATGIIEDQGRVAGVVANSPEGTLTVKADLVIGADGRSSIIRECAKLEVEDVGAPMDVLWMRLSRTQSDPPQTLGRIDAGVFFIMLNRDQYWQCAFLIAKGSADKFREEGIEAFRERIVKIAPFTADRVEELKSFDEVKLLTVKVDRLKQWYRDGLLCIGDSAHAMSPVGGVGINLAIQDAVAAANILYKPLLKGRCSMSDLKAVQDRRSYPTRMTQRFQVAIQNRVIRPTLQSTTPPKPPWYVRTFCMIPPLRAIPANLIGRGFRPEHIHTPESKG